jgi:hypothetical protein
MGRFKPNRLANSVWRAELGGVILRGVRAECPRSEPSYEAAVLWSPQEDAKPLLVDV